MPSADYNGAASLTLSVNDGSTANASSVAIGVLPVADIGADAVTTAEDTAVAINVLANDTFEGGSPAIVAVNGQAISVGGAAVAVANGSVALNALGPAGVHAGAQLQNTRPRPRASAIR